MNDTTPATNPEQLRLLEGWLPLAQDANERYGWGLDAVALEALVIHAAPALSRACSVLEAQAVLWSSEAYLAAEASSGPRDTEAPLLS